VTIVLKLAVVLDVAPPVMTAPNIAVKVVELAAATTVVLNIAVAVATELVAAAALTPDFAIWLLAKLVVMHFLARPVA
jgi:hypothetical protein